MAANLISSSSSGMRFVALTAVYINIARIHNGEKHFCENTERIWDYIELVSEKSNTLIDPRALIRLASVLRIKGTSVIVLMY